MQEFLDTVKKRLNKGVALNALCIAVLIASMIVIISALFYLFRGYAVSGWVFFSGLYVAVGAWLTMWYLQKKDIRQAAIFTDKYYELKDAVISAISFKESKKEEKYKDLQYAQTEDRMKSLDPGGIPLPLPRKLLIGSAVSLVIASSLSFIPPSQEILDKQAKEKEISDRTAQIKEKLKEEVERLIDGLSDDEKALIDPDKIRKWVEDMEPTMKEREAMLNIARAKQEIQKQIQKLENRKDEALLKVAGMKLKESSMSKARRAGEAMSQKDFEAVKKALDEFKLGKEKKEELKDEIQKLAEKLKQGEKLTEEEREKLMQKLKEKLAEMRELTKRMAQAADEQEGLGDGDMGELDDFELDDLPEDFPMDQLMELLDKRAMEMQDEMDGEMLDGEPMSAEELLELLEMLEEMEEGLDEMQGEMDEMEARRKLRARLKGLRGAMGRAQGFAQGKSKTLGLAGGKKPGVGTDQTRRNERDKDIDNDNFSKIKGKQGQGPVQRKVEAADSGTGTSRRKGTAIQRDYQKQMSSYLNRDDIPEDMKQAMRQYYQDIHDLEQVEE